MCWTCCNWRIPSYRCCNAATRSAKGGEVWFVGEAEELGPGNEVHRGHHDLQPGVVGCIGVAGEVPHAGGLRLPDPVLDPGVLPVPQIQPGQLPGNDPGRGVGDEPGDPVPVDIEERQLRAGVWSFLPQDHPAPGGPGRQVEQPGGFGDPGAVPHRAVGVDRRVPHVDAVQAGQPGRVGQPGPARPGPAISRRTRRRTRPLAAGRTPRNHKWHQRNRTGSTPRDCPGRPAAAGTLPGSTPALR